MNALEVLDRVNAKLAALPVYAQQMPSDRAQRELLELVLWAKEVPAVAGRLSEMLARRAPLILCDIEDEAGAAAPLFRYRLEESARELLLACRSGVAMQETAQ